VSGLKCCGVQVELCLEMETCVFPCAEVVLSIPDSTFEEKNHLVYFYVKHTHT